MRGKVTPALLVIAAATVGLFAARRPRPANVNANVNVSANVNVNANANANVNADVNVEVAARNRAEPNQAEAFRAGGWELVAAPPPDAHLLRYDPALLDGRERELRTQLASTVAAPGDVTRIAAIVRRARERETRVAAVEALGRVRTSDAQRALVELLAEGGLTDDDPARRLVVPLLRPSALDDPEATELARLLDSSSLTAIEKRQLAFTLSLVGLRDGMTLAPEVTAALSPPARLELDQMNALARAGTSDHPNHADHPGENP